MNKNKQSFYVRKKKKKKNPSTFLQMDGSMQK